MVYTPQLHVGDRVTAHCDMMSIHGHIVCGWSPKMHEFTMRLGAAVAKSEVLAIKLDERDLNIVRVSPLSWEVEQLTIVPEAEDLPLATPPSGLNNRRVGPL